MNRLVAALSLLLATSCLELPGSLRRPLINTDAVAYGVERDPVPPEAERVRFAVVGDVGLNNHVQAAVARGVHRACNNDSCDFVVLLGDNLYEEGVTGKEDEARLACIVSRYPTQHAYLTLGNHDYKIIAPSEERARAELDWIRGDSATDGGIEARGAFHFYRFQAGPVDMVALDTNYLVRSTLRVAYEHLVGWLGRLRKREGRWTIVMGHHPYLSNGTHGNAGSYRDGGLRLWPGRFFQFFMQKHVLGRAHLYLSGHDHNLQFYRDVDNTGTAQVVSGSGAKCRERGRADNVADMERYGFGFAVVEATHEDLAVSFHDFEGERFWSSKRTARGAWKDDVPPGASGDPLRMRCADDQSRMPPIQHPDTSVCTGKR